MELVRTNDTDQTKPARAIIFIVEPICVAYSFLLKETGNRKDTKGLEEG